MIKRKTFLALAVLGAFGTAQADITGGQSDPDSAFQLGVAEIGPKKFAGVKISGQLGNKVRDIQQHIANPAVMNPSNHVYNFSGRKLAEKFHLDDHIGVGVWSFVEVGTGDVWFGEWDAEATSGKVGTKVPGTHTVWYTGENDDVATTLPKTPVSYTIRSINNYSAGSTLPTSTLKADFNTWRASSTGDIDFSNGIIKASDSDVNLKAAGVRVVSAGGDGGNLEGQFYGTGAAGVAGMVTFSDRNKNTAFGGSKDAWEKSDPAVNPRLESLRQ